MEQRLANTWRMTVNEKKFIETALLSNLRVDGRAPFDYRKISIKFGREDGSAEVQLGQTHVMSFVTSQLVQPYRDRPNEGTLSIYTEFSPMADPSFEAGRPGEYAVELGRIIDRGLRESRAVDMESLCVLSGKSVWAIRIHLHVLDNGGNLLDAANIAALAALKTFRRPDCSLGGDDGQEVIVHPPEVREPLPLIIHHLPIAVTYAFFSNESAVVIDPTHFEEAVMGGRMTTTLNTNGDICAIQKGGGECVLQSVIMQCLRIAKMKAEEITKIIDAAVESYETERTLQKIKHRPPSVAVDVGEPCPKGGENHRNYVTQEVTDELSMRHMERLTLTSAEICATQSNDLGDGSVKCVREGSKRTNSDRKFIGAPSNWDPYSKGVDSEYLKASLASQGTRRPIRNQKETKVEERHSREIRHDQLDISQSDGDSKSNTASSPADMSHKASEKQGEKTLIDAIKPKHKRKKKSLSSSSSGAQ